MKKTRRFLCLLLTLVLALSLCAIPAAAADTQTRSDDPGQIVRQAAGGHAPVGQHGVDAGALAPAHQAVHEHDRVVLAVNDDGQKCKNILPGFFSHTPVE